MSKTSIVIMFPQQPQRQASSEVWIEETKRICAKKEFPKSGPRVRVAPFQEIIPNVVKDLRYILETVERDAREGREELAMMIGAYEYMLDEGRAALHAEAVGMARIQKRRARKNSGKGARHV